MNAIVLKIDGKKYYLNESGCVLDEQLTPSSDSWTSLSAVENDKNTLGYTLNGVPQKRLRSRYSFNADNQLVVTLFKKENPELDDDSINVLAGGIRTDTNLNIVYTMIDSAGNNQNSLTVFGTPGMVNPFVLKIDLVGGGEARIVANAKRNTPLEWDKNRQDVKSAAYDLLKFKAITKNNLQDLGGIGYKFISADLTFGGIWGMDKDGLFFDVEGGGDKPIRLNLQGSYKAVSGGLIFEYSQGKAKCVLAIEGRHQLDQGTATWKLCIGHSQEARNTYIALKVEGDLKQSFSEDKVLTLSGSLKYEGGTATTPTVALELNATYEFAGGACLIKAFYKTDGVVKSYGLHLSGHVLFESGKLTYDFSYGSDKTISFEVLYDGTSTDFENYFNLKVNVDTNGKVSCAFDFRISFTFENGVLLPPISKRLQNLAS